MKPLYYSALAPPQVASALAFQANESLRPVIDILKAWGESHRERLSCAPDPAAVPLPDRAA